METGRSEEIALTSPLMCRGVRGATTVTENSEDAILAATRGLPLAGGGLYLRGDYSYLDDHLTNASPETDEDDIQDRNLLNARIGWRNDRWNISFWGKNLTEDDYASLTANTFVFSGMDAFFLAPPRTYGATVRYDF